MAQELLMGGERVNDVGKARVILIERGFNGLVLDRDFERVAGTL